MKGRKEIVNWMVNNPNKKLECTEVKYVIWYNDMLSFNYDFEDRERPLGGSISGKLTNHSVLDSYEWTIVKKLIKFREAYDDCEMNGTVYYENHDFQNNVMRKNDEGYVEIYFNGRTYTDFSFDSLWYKKED